MHKIVLIALHVEIKCSQVRHLNQCYVLIERYFCQFHFSFLELGCCRHRCLLRLWSGLRTGRMPASGSQTVAVWLSAPTPLPASGERWGQTAVNASPGLVSYPQA